MRPRSVTVASECQVAGASFGPGLARKFRPQAVNPQISGLRQRPGRKRGPAVPRAIEAVFGAAPGYGQDGCRREPGGRCAPTACAARLMQPGRSMGGQCLCRCWLMLRLEAGVCAVAAGGRGGRYQSSCCDEGSRSGAAPGQPALTAPGLVAIAQVNYSIGYESGKRPVTLTDRPPQHCRNMSMTVVAFWYDYEAGGEPS